MRTLTHLRTQEQNVTHLRTLIISHSCSRGVGWGGVGWDNDVHVPVHTQEQQPHHLSCCIADTGTALS